MAKPLGIRFIVYTGTKYNLTTWFFHLNSITLLHLVVLRIATSATHNGTSNDFKLSSNFTSFHIINRYHHFGIVSYQSRYEKWNEMEHYHSLLKLLLTYECRSIWRWSMDWQYIQKLRWSCLSLRMRTIS